MPDYKCPHCNRLSYSVGGLPVCCHCGKKVTRRKKMTDTIVCRCGLDPAEYCHYHGVTRLAAHAALERSE